MSAPDLTAEQERTFGEVLKLYRTLIPLTLRQVEEAIGVSNAYLSQLENDKIKRPSANVLYKLASLYGVSLDILLYACGILPEKPVSIEMFAFKVTKDEEQQLLDYLQFLRSKKHRP